MNLLFVFIGGGLGSLCRYGIGTWLSDYSFPYGTLVANFISCLLLGFFIGLASQEILKSDARLFLMTGFCGGFSTFSTFSGEIIALIQNGQLTSGILYIFASLAIGLLAILLGLFIAKSFSLG